MILAKKSGSYCAPHLDLCEVSAPLKSAMSLLQPATQWFPMLSDLMCKIEISDSLSALSKYYLLFPFFLEKKTDRERDGPAL